jgi:Fe-S cluster assembly iron-binding protein IscA
MKHLFLFLSLAMLHLTAAAQTPVNKWIKNIVEDMKQMNSLAPYSSVELPEDATVNFFMVEEVKDITVTEDRFTMLINSGNGKYCNKVTFQYIKKDDSYYLVFAEPQFSEIFGKQKLFVDPWVEVEKLCK